MNPFLKKYTQLIWCLSYFPVKDPSIITSHSTPRQLSVPGILNILHCASVLVFLVDSTNYMGSMRVSVSQHMLFSIGNYVNILVLLIVRLTAARSSAALFHTLKYLQAWDSHCKKKLTKVSILVIAMLFGSTAYGVCQYVNLAMDSRSMEMGGYVERYPVLGLAVMLSMALTDYTAVLFALSYVVVIGQELTHAYGCICISLKDSELGSNHHKVRALKLQFKLLTKLARAFEKSTKWYSAGVIASSAVAWLQVIAIVATDWGRIRLPHVYYALSNVLSFALLMYVGNCVKKEVSQSSTRYCLHA